MSAAVCYRAQIRSIHGAWVDGALCVDPDDAERDRVELAERYAGWITASRVVEVTS